MSTALAAKGSAAKRFDAWSRGYAPMPGIPDEFMDADGRCRPHWRRMLSALAAYEPNEMQQRFSAADRRIRSRGLSYRVAGEKDERVWPISRMPLLVAEAEWREIAQGVVQRAELLERVLADIYGKAGLIADGALPAAAVSGSTDFLAAMSGVKPPGGRWLRLYAVDIGRGPDGGWWVLGDRAQAPSGCGYALENRLVVSQAFPDLYAQLNVERLAPFFRALGGGLKSAGERAEPRIGIMSPGPMSLTYSEQAYLARYLGFLLVEGDDLVMREGRIFVRTIAGLKRCDVIWRHVDADWCDPLELNSSSRIGVPGLLEAIRQGGVAVENMPGAGLIESRAMLAFLPALSRSLLGQDLMMPNVATWWCGQSRERDRVLDEFDRISIASAFGGELPALPGRASVIAEELMPSERARLRNSIAVRGLDYVGQEVVRLSTAPRWTEDRLEPRPFVLRVYCAAGPDGWRVMPGGFCRISDRLDARALSMGDGVEFGRRVGARRESRRGVDQPSHPGERSDYPAARKPAEPRRGQSLLVRALPRTRRGHAARGTLSQRPFRRPGRAHASWPAIAGKTDGRPRRLGRGRCSGSRGRRDRCEQPGFVGPGALRVGAVSRALGAERGFRHTGTPDPSDLGPDRTAGKHDRPAPQRRLPVGEIVDLTDEALTIIAALSGLFDENFNRGAGWVFYVMGRCVERGANTCRLLRHFAGDDATEHTLGVMLDLIDSQITYSSRYLVGAALAPVRDMALLDPFNPRSVAFQVNRIEEGIATLPVLRRDGILEEPKRLTTQLSAELTTERPEFLNDLRILAVEQRLLALANAIAARYFLQGAGQGRAERVTGLA